jgi:hypothetical protein
MHFWKSAAKRTFGKVQQNHPYNLGHKLGHNLGHKLGHNLGHKLGHKIFISYTYFVLTQLLVEKWVLLHFSKSAV